ncbi:MAG TPA: hypothetical protein VKH81_02370 [Candidatus Angelobacter sp.]|nr:hypothetical protein [Candidatus Angelobacter sp.]
MAKRDGSPGIGIKLIALMLTLGGIFGVVVGLYQQWQTLAKVGIWAAALVGLFVLLFGWSAWVGFELWHGEPWAFKWGKVIVAAQIPIFTVPGFSFDGFFTGLRISFAISERAPILRFGFNLSSSIHFEISRQVDYWLFGINLVAVVALVHLMSAPAANGPAKDKFGLI